MVNIFFLFLGLLQAEASYELAKIPISYSVKKITCEKAFNNTVTFVQNPNYTPHSNQPITLVKYKGKNVFVHWCKDINDNFVR